MLPLQALNNTEPGLVDGLDSCIKVVNDQAVELVQDEHDHMKGSRKKRTIDNSAFLRWDMPIHWKFDGNHSTYFSCIGPRFSTELRDAVFLYPVIYKYDLCRFTAILIDSVTVMVRYVARFWARLCLIWE